METRADTGTSAHDRSAHVLLISPEAEHGRGVREWLAAQRDPVLHVTHLASLEAGVRMLSDSTVEALVLDLSIEGLSPLDTCRQLRAVAPHVAIVLNAPPDQETIAVQALHEGADSYVIQGPSDGRVVASTVCNALRRARAEAELREEQERHRYLLDLLDDGVGSLDARGCFVDANAAMARLLGYDGPYDLRGISLRDVYAGPGTVDTLLEQLAAGGTLARAEVELLCRAGERITVWIRGRGLQPDGNRRAVAEIVCTDVSTERRLEQEARQNEPLILGGTLAAGAAVEIQRLMNAVDGAHDLLGQVIDENHPRRSDLQYLREITTQAAVLSDGLLVTTRRLALRPLILDAATVLERLQPTLHDAIGEGISVQLPPAGFSAGQVTSVPGELERVVIELTSIARGLDRDAPVTVLTAPVYLDATYAREHLVLMPGHYVSFVVTTSSQSLDTLIAPDWGAERSYSPEPADRDTARELASIYRTVTLAGGHFAVRRTAGYGATFKVYLPRVDCPGRRGTILLVEDEPSIRCGGRQLLELLDYRVIEAGDADEAIWLASRFREPIDLLIADVVLPGLSGHEMAERLVAGGYVSQVLYMSGLLQETLVERAALPAGAMFIEKPFTMAQLRTCIRQILEDDAPA